MTSPIILAVDTPELDTAKRWIEATRESVSVYKLGLEFFLSFGAAGVADIQSEFGVDIFLDLKLHDIPNTVGSAARSLSALSPRFLTVHASGGSSMIRAAVEALPQVDITAVTILTSLSEEDLFEIGYAHPALESVVALGELAKRSGARAIVSSPLEISALRSSLGDEIAIITPGVRPAGVRPAGVRPAGVSLTGKSVTDDQVRTMTPREAIAAGATFVVIGRPITGSWSNLPSSTSVEVRARAMSDAAKSILQEIAG